jgi:hypothetical protein
MIAMKRDDHHRPWSLGAVPLSRHETHDKVIETPSTA